MKLRAVVIGHPATTRILEGLASVGDRLEERAQPAAERRRGVSASPRPREAANRTRRRWFMRAVRPQHWRFEADPKGGGLGGQIPSLQITRHPDQLLFLAKRGGPYTLDYGSHKVHPSSFSHQDLLAFLPGDDVQPGQATVGPERVEGGESARKAPPSPEPLPLPNIILWTILLGGVGVLLIFVRNLMAEMKDQA